ncbi:hypothetical protein OIU77_029679 [Salix suchowensis]|uniref:Histidine-tRNA ligase n=1 Tax=Salix suchowensis TaxID=1278906 RepID=A0ABQ9B9E1_9ROSI|nr:hypothetical protein OIU77_029679 [Salix suchowensis]
MLNPVFPIKYLYQELLIRDCFSPVSFSLEIKKVQNLIERCLQLYMNQNEVVDTLLAQAKIEPGFTELVWQKLEEENREFFRAYYLRLKVKQQIEEFNKLLVQQAHLMRDLNSTGVVSMPASNGSHIPQMHQNTACYGSDHTGPALKPGSMHHPIGSGLTNAYTNGGSSLHSSMHAAVEIAARSSEIDAPPKHAFNAELKHRSAARNEWGNDQIRSRLFGSGESSSQALGESILDADTSSFGFLSQIPRNFSLSDLTADFTQSSEILENYPRSPYLAADNDNFPDSRERDPVDNRRLDTISEGMSYDDFGSE